jgi:hypothetical protein
MWYRFFSDAGRIAGVSQLQTHKITIFSSLIRPNEEHGRAWQGNPFPTRKANSPGQLP